MEEYLKIFCEPVPDYENGRFRTENGKIKLAYGKEALKIWLHKALQPTSRRYGYEAFGKNYGHEIGAEIGRSSASASVILGSIRDFLCANPYILDVALKSYSFEGDSLTATLTVATVYDEIEMTEVIKE